MLSIEKYIYSLKDPHYVFAVETADDMKTLGNTFAACVFPPSETAQTHITKAAFMSAMLPLLPTQNLKDFCLTAFAHVANPTEEQSLRIGLIGQPFKGKTTFATGMLDAAGEKYSMDSLNQEYRTQNLWYSSRMGWIRHYDAHLEKEENLLHSYHNVDLARHISPKNDIVEHPGYDAHDTEFHYMISFERPDIMRDLRHVAFKASPEQKASPGFQTFLSSSQAWLIK
jgi:hypothetical protein